MKDSVVKENIIFNVIKTIVNVVIPIVMFMYVTRVISVEGLGKVTFAKNYTSYFCLIATLGISYYSIREAARIREDKKQFSLFFWEIFIINLITTTFAFFIFFISVLFVAPLQKYTVLLYIDSWSIILSGMSCEWVLGAIEKYKFIAIRTIFMQLICLSFVFIFVKDENDYLVYAILLMVSSYFPTIINIIYIVRNDIIDKVRIRELKIQNHLKPVIILFAMLLSIDLYTLLDTTMLGFIKGDWSVGIYSVAIKVPRLVNSIIASVGAVLVPRLSYYFEKDKKEFDLLIWKAIRFVYMITVPCAIGLFLLSDEVILLFGGAKYETAGITLRILSIIIFIIPVTVLFNNQIFIPMRKEILVLKSTCIGAFTNIIVNLLFIPLMAENGAAIGSVFAELVVMCVCLYNVKKELMINGLFKMYITLFIKSSIIIFPIIISKLLISNYILCIIISIFVSICLWGVIMHKELKVLIFK